MDDVAKLGMSTWLGFGVVCQFKKLSRFLTLEVHSFKDVPVKIIPFEHQKDQNVAPTWHL